MIKHDKQLRFVRPTLGITAALVLFSGPIHAQWLKYPTPGIPRLQDGRPDLTAPTPRTGDGKVDLSGVWQNVCGIQTPCQNRGLFFDLARDLDPSAVQMTPWAAQVQEQRQSRDHVDDPYGYCLPMGVPRMTVNAPFRIVVTPGLTAFLVETVVGPVFRQVFTDGRPLPEVSEPTWLGYSIGHWEGDTFVVESSGFRDGGWLDTLRGRPNSDALRVTERFRRTNVGQMELVITIDDRKAYLKPWTVSTMLQLLPDTELPEAFCDSHEKSMEHRRISPPPPEPPSSPLR